MKKISIYVFVGVLLAGTLPLLLQRFFGVTFLPSPDWVASTSAIALLFGAFMAILSVFLLFKTRQSNPKMAEASLLKVAFLLLGAGGLVLMSGYLFVIQTVPMAHAAALGTETSLEFVVDDPRSSGSRGCRPAISLQNMSFMASDLCGTPPALKAAVSTGDMVTAHGKGTSLGVFYDSFSVGQ